MWKANTIEIVKLVISIIVCQLAGFVGSLFTTPSIPTWYAALRKPVFNPPNSVFGPVWTTLFLLMGISAYLIWRKGLQDKNVKMALIIFIVQLGLNVIWSILFFGLHSPFSAFMEIIILWLVILATFLYFMKISKPAGILLIPYLIWVAFAAILNYHLWKLNS
ncbi:MAG TPA: TspO/MBR family protein [candidate division Zixibacteria bacterium]